MTAFSIGTNQKFDTAADIEPKLAGLKPGVKVVNFGGNSYGVGACEAIAAKLEGIDTIEVANLDDMFTGRLREEIPKSMDSLLTALLKLPNLHTVNLSDNAFGIATIAPLEKFLSQHTPLEHLILANNGFGPEAGARVGQALETLAEKKHAGKHAAKLQTVVCGRNRLENGSMAAWARFLKAHGTITDLRVYQNGIRQEGIEVLMRDGLAHSSKITVLDLQDNTFTERGTKAMVEALENWPELKELGISDCLLTAKGGELFARKLATSKTLQQLEILRLQYNEIDAAGLEHIAAAVHASLPGLKLLELNGNRFSEDHEHIFAINETFASRGFGELDELDDMEEETDDEDEDEDDDEDVDAQLEAGARDAQYREDEPVPEDSDSKVDQLAEKLAKTDI